MNRRELMIGSLSGVAIGSGWVAGFGMVLQHQEPTLSVIGEGKSLLALLDTGRVRVLVAAGPGEPRLMRNLNALLGVFRPRIDILLGGESGIAEFTPRIRARYGNPRRMILDHPTGITMSTQAATGPPILTTQLPSGMNLRIETFVRNAWQMAGTPTQSWIVTIGGHGHRCAISDTIDVLAMHGDAGLAVGLVGSMSRGDQWDMLSGSSLALPSGQVDSTHHNQLGPAPIRLFPRDPVTITFRPDGLGIKT